MTRSSSKLMLQKALLDATRLLEEPLHLPPAPDTWKTLYDDVMEYARREAATYGLDDTAWFNNHRKKRLHGLLMAPTQPEAARIAQSIKHAVQIHLILVAHRAGKLTRMAPEEVLPAEG